MTSARMRSWIGAATLVSCLIPSLLTGCKAHDALGRPEAVAPKGSFEVVGIGPGDADLLTGRALEAIRRADLVFCDQETRERLAPLVDFRAKEVRDGYGALSPYYGLKCDAGGGERSGDEATCDRYHQRQAEFAALVRQAVARGQHAVLLSGGDPTLYGPDAWSLTELRDLEPDVVPGLSAFNAANAALQTSLGEVILTAPFARGQGEDAILSIPTSGQVTTVLFMPRDARDLASSLRRAQPAHTPVAVVSHAGQAGRLRVVRGTVANVGEKLAGVDLASSLVYVGEALAKTHVRPRDVATAGKGKYYLVGMGPGDADLATLRARDVVARADLIFANQRLAARYAPLLAGKKTVDGYGRLFPFYGKNCKEVDQASRARESMSCEDYHRKQAEFASLVRSAVAKGQTVALLDSGDPLIYGPSAWTVTELADLGAEVVPGLSCFNAANAALRAAVTDGKDARSVILASGYSVDEMATHRTTMVLFTFRTEFKKFIDSLSKHYPAHTPVAIVQSAGYADREKVTRATLGSILERVKDDKLPFEYLLYVGDTLADDARRPNG
jgi:precorrin-4 methylase